MSRQQSSDDRSIYSKITSQIYTVVSEVYVAVVIVVCGGGGGGGDGVANCAQELGLAWGNGSGGIALPSTQCL